MNPVFIFLVVVLGVYLWVKTSNVWESTGEKIEKFFDKFKEN